MVGTLVMGCRSAMVWCTLDLAFDLVIVTLTYNVLSKLYISNSHVWKLILSRDIGVGCMCAS